ncbi:MAG: GntR family transcriptional regulator [Mesorhizobium sp.]|uniref:GntR family transcriptional regulator n=1 Tax=Mesorhizobium sp. TaxID=1871066 RepID=UPI000FE78460|nr:GntR family transcriptional regulator [Mesorhizobium sp.]RWI57055.1 MAG: GntR family transcriptional regulator [Mesorhizobium sp.]
MTRPESGSLTAEAYAQIRAEILACRLAPGHKLVIADLCQEFEFSLGAVREALARLTSEGLVVSEPRKGFRVAPITEEELRDITRVRATIESLCLESAIRNGDLKWETNIVATQFELSKLSLQDPADPARVSDIWAQAHKRFHEALVSACDSPWLLRLRELLFMQSERYRRVSVPLDRTKRDLASEHREIADAAVNRDVEAATAAIRKHLEKTTRILIESEVVKAREG